MVRDCGSFELVVQTLWTCFIVLHVEVLPGVQLCLSERGSSGCAVSSVDSHQFEIVHCAVRSSRVSVLFLLEGWCCWENRGSGSEPHGSRSPSELRRCSLLCMIPVAAVEKQLS